MPEEKQLGLDAATRPIAPPTEDDGIAISEHEASPTEAEAPVLLDGPALPEILTETFVARFERAVETYKRWVSVCYRLTRPAHWLRRGERFDLQGPGAEALAGPLGLIAHEPVFRREDLKSADGKPFYIYWCEGIIESKTLGRLGWFIGSCDSLDEFFSAKKSWDPERGAPDVKKSAYTNWFVNGVTRLAGIRNPDPETLAAAGITLSRVPVADYSGRKLPEQDREAITEPQAKRLWAIAKGREMPDEILREYLKSHRIESVKDIPRGKYAEICAWVEAWKSVPTREKAK